MIMQNRPTLALCVVALVLAVGMGAAPEARARLAVRARPSMSPLPTPTVPGPLATPVSPPVDGDPCQAGIRRAASSLASSTHRALGSCIVPGIECLADASNLDSCCAAAASRCRRQIANVGDAGAEFERAVTRRACDDLSLDVLLAPDGLGFGVAIAGCERLDPPVVIDDEKSLAKCLRRLIVEDVVHRMIAVEHPRALEAVFCMGVEEEIPGVQRDDPATCAGSGVPGVPTPTPTPDPIPTPDPGETPDPSQTPNPQDPTPTPNVGPQTCDKVTVVASAEFDQTNFPDVSGLTIDVAYPPTKAEIPGFGGETSVADRVTNLTGVTSGLFNVADQDDPGQGAVKISVGLVAIPGPIPPGTFASVEFDCRSGASAPTTSDFSCSIDGSTLLGAAVDATCSLAVTVQ